MTQPTGFGATVNDSTGAVHKTNLPCPGSPDGAKGDVIASDGTWYQRLVVGADTFVLTADSAQPLGVKWAAAGGGGMTVGSAVSGGTNSTVLFIDASGNLGSTSAFGFVGLTGKITTLGVQPASVSSGNGTSAGTTVSITGAKGGDTTAAGTTQTGGTGGAITITTGAGGLATAATATITNGTTGGLTLQSGTGQNAVAAGSVAGKGGASGSVVLSSGVGGDSTGTTSGTNTGGNAGSVFIAVNPPGIAQGSSGTNVGGSAGSLSITTPTGGAAGDGGIGGSGGVTATGGNSGTITVGAGNGGSAQQASGTSKGGNGGALVLTSGRGGAATDATTNNGGNGGNVTITASVGGSGSTASGTDGYLAGTVHGNTFKLGGAIFDHFADVGNVTTGETDLFTDTTPAKTLAKNGDKITAVYGGTTVGQATATRQLRVYFGGTMIYDSTAQITAVADDWEIRVTVQRDSATSVRCSVSFTNKLNTAAFAGVNCTAVTGLTLTATNILKVTGQAGAVGAATNDIVAKLGYVEWEQAA